MWGGGFFFQPLHKFLCKSRDVNNWDKQLLYNSFKYHACLSKSDKKWAFCSNSRSNILHGKKVTYVIKVSGESLKNWTLKCSVINMLMGQLYTVFFSTFQENMLWNSWLVICRRRIGRKNCQMRRCVQFSPVSMRSFSIIKNLPSEYKNSQVLLTKPVCNRRPLVSGCQKLPCCIKKLNGIKPHCLLIYPPA